MAVKNYGLVKDLDQLEKFVERLTASGSPISFDIETGYDGTDSEGVSLLPDHPDSKVVGISFTNSTDWARYVPLAHDLADNFDPLPTARLFWRLLSSGLGVAHNAKFELRHLARWFRELLSDDPDVGPAVTASRGYFPVLSDTLIEAYIDATQRSLGLKVLSKALFDHEQTELMALFPGLAKGRQRTLRFNILELTPEVVAYACEDSVWCLALHQRFYPQVKDNLLYRVEMQVLPILCDMEDFGVRFDWRIMREKAVEGRAFLDAMNDEIQADLSAMLGEPVSVNLGSYARVGEILFDRLGFPVAKRTNSGKASTSAQALSKLASRYPVVQRILEWKEVRVLLTRYLEKFEKDYGYALDGMTHPNHLQTAVGTGRFAVSSPPYQQAPKIYHYELKSGRTYDLNFRDLVTCPPDHYLLGFDFSQVELRMMAGESGEPSLLQSFEIGEDVHTATAALMLGIPRETVTKEQRAIGKTLNFALLYGMGPASLSERLGLSKEEGQQLFDQYFAAYSAIGVWVDRVTREGKKRGYTLSKFGRRFTIWELQSTDQWVYSKGERLCVNAPIQGAAADYMKIAMVRVHKALAGAGLLDRVHLAMNIHDALEFYVHHSVPAEQVIRLLDPAVTFAVPGLPKIVADWHRGQRWGSLEELKWDGTTLTVKGAVRLLQAAAATDIDEEGGDLDDEPDLDVDAFRAAYSVTCESPVEPPRESYAPDNREAEIVHAAAAVALAERPVVTPPEVARRLLVSLEEMPNESQYRAWLDLLAGSRGPHECVLRTPEGDVVYETGVALTPDRQPEVSMLLGGAAVKWDADGYDVTGLADGLRL